MNIQLKAVKHVDFVDKKLIAPEKNGEKMKKTKRPFPVFSSLFWGELFSTSGVLTCRLPSTVCPPLRAQEVGQWPETRGLGWELWGPSRSFFFVVGFF